MWQGAVGTCHICNFTVMFSGPFSRLFWGLPVMPCRGDFWAGTLLLWTGCAAPSPARLVLAGGRGLTQRGGCHPAAFLLPSWDTSLPQCWKMDQSSSLPSLASAKEATDTLSL